MIKTPTLLITGAGSSMPFGYPSGKRLVSEIIELLSFNAGTLVLASSYNPDDDEIDEKFTRQNPNLDRDFLESAGFSEQFSKKFRDALRDSNMDSIDAFLETRKEYIEIGKFCIALILLRREHVGRVTFPIDSWLRYIWNHLNASKQEFRLNKLTIATFNYDRFIEMFLFTSIKAKFGIPDAETRRILSNLNIIHLHGRLVELPWESEDGYSYGYDKEKPNDLFNAAKKSVESIKIISEDIDMGNFAQVHEGITITDQVFFLGFGFHPINVNRLSLKTLNKGSICSAYGITKNEAKQINLNAGWKLDFKFGYKNLELLRDFMVLQGKPNPILNPRAHYI